MVKKTMDANTIPLVRLYHDLAYLRRIMSPPVEYAGEASHWRAVLREARGGCVRASIIACSSDGFRGRAPDRRRVWRPADSGTDLAGIGGCGPAVALHVV